MRATLDAYVAVWSEHNARKRRDLLQQCWSETSEIIGPGYRFKGIEAVDREIERFHREQPGSRAIATSGFDGHGSWARFTIALLDADGRVVSEGWDVVELDPSNKIRQVISFWGGLPPAPSARP